MRRYARLIELLSISKVGFMPPFGEEDPEETDMETGIKPGIEHPDLEPLAAILMGEAGVEGIPGMTAVYHVILNRARKLGKQPLQVARDPAQFSILNERTTESLIKEFKQSPDPRTMGLWQAAKSIALNPGADPTSGATHYYNPSIVMPVWASENNPCWIKGPRIGRHQFGQERSDPLWGTSATGRCYIQPKK